MSTDLTFEQWMVVHELEQERGPATDIYLLPDYPRATVYPNDAPAEIAWPSGRTLLDPDGTVVAETWLPQDQPPSQRADSRWICLTDFDHGRP